MKSFIKESLEEIKNKVTWPSYDSLQSSSKLVLAVSFIFAVVIGMVDVTFRTVISWFYGKF